MTPDRVMDTTLWALAAFLGADVERVPPAPADGRARGVLSGRDIAAEQAAYERGEGPEPQARPVALGALPAWMLEGLTSAEPPG